MAHEARTDFGMILSCVFLAMVGEKGRVSFDWRFFSGRDGND